MPKIQIIILFFLLPFSPSFGQTIEGVKLKIQQILLNEKAEVGVAIRGKNAKDTLSINGDKHLPMQSVFKFHIALAVLSEIDKGKLSLNQVISIKQEDLLPNLYSPIREKYPKGTTLSLAEVLEYTVAKSDNVGCDILLKLIGGPRFVEDFFKKKGFQNISIKINESTMQNDWDSQFLNWTSPKAANQVLLAFYENSNNLLSKNSHRFLWKTMKATETGADRLKGKLPKGTVVAHKTGFSGTNKDGVTAAVNDIGIVFLPDGNYFLISVFVSNSRENITENERIIANIAKTAWDYFKEKPKE